MKNKIEIRWHGRGGQGAKTAALLFAEVANVSGFYVQAFPEYGPERSGAPVKAFNRLSKEPIRSHCAISAPDIVLVLDPSLIGQVKVTEGLKKDGILLVNSPNDYSYFKDKFDFKNRILTIDASKIALSTLGKDIPSGVMVGVLIKILDLDLEKTIPKIEKKITEKISEDLVAANIRAIRQAYYETQYEKRSLQK
jgi:pyruvate ferredoxin oxidoreductase gamma subunit